MGARHVLAEEMRKKKIAIYKMIFCHNFLGNMKFQTKKIYDGGCLFESYAMMIEAMTCGSM